MKQEHINHRFKMAQAIVEKQAADEGLWFQAETAPEAYLQSALRRLHAALEGDDIMLAVMEREDGPADLP